MCCVLLQHNRKLTFRMLADLSGNRSCWCFLGVALRAYACGSSIRPQPVQLGQIPFQRRLCTRQKLHPMCRGARFKVEQHHENAESHNAKSLPVAVPHGSTNAAAKSDGSTKAVALVCPHAGVTRVPSATADLAAEIPLWAGALPTASVPPAASPGLAKGQPARRDIASLNIIHNGELTSYDVATELERFVGHSHSTQNKL